ncbi:MAG: hypothetical protein GX053_12350 [Tissierella sp.]|nr:hypothetical protein [Tissierella sp.]
MTGVTANYGLKKPSEEDFYNVNDFNYNVDIIDTELRKNKDKTDNITGENIKLSDGTTLEEKFIEVDTGIENAHDLAQQAFQSASNGKVLVAGAITGKGVLTAPSDTFSKMATNINAIETDPSIGKTDAIASDILKGKKAVSQGNLLTGSLELAANALAAQVLNAVTFYNTNPKSKLTGTMPNVGKQVSRVTTKGGKQTISKGYHDGTGYIDYDDPNHIAANIKKGVNLGGVMGTLEYEDTLFQVYEGLSSRHDTSVSGTTTDDVVINNPFNASLIIFQYTIGRYHQDPTWSAYNNPTAVRAFASTKFKPQSSSNNLYEGKLNGTVRPNQAIIRWDLARDDSRVMYRVIFVR